MEVRPHRRPVWQSGNLSRLVRFLRNVLKQLTFSRTVLAVFVLPLLFYIFREVTHDALIIDPFTVPKRFEEAGLTSEVMANRIGDALRHIEITTQTQMKKDNLTSLRDEGSMPDVEIPGTKIGLKTLVDITRAVFGIYPKHVSGDIVVHATVPPNAEPQATVTFYITQGRNRGEAESVGVSALDIGLLAQRTAEMVLGQVNPYVLAVYREEHHEFDEAVEIVQRMVQDPSEDRIHTSAAFNLWGVVLEDQMKDDDAVAKYQKAIELDPKKTRFAYFNWGIVVHRQKKYDEAVAKYHKTIELNPKDAVAYNNWGEVLYDQKKYGEAAAKYQKAIEFNPKYADAYNNWGFVLYDQKKYEEAVAKYRKAIEFNPKNSVAYTNWGIVLYTQKKYDEAQKKLAKAREVLASQ
jgi:Tfp pilus assembly protein PilF